MSTKISFNVEVCVDDAADIEQAMLMVGANLNFVLEDAISNGLLSLNVASDSEDGASVEGLSLSIVK